ncbi:hypothetical protein SSS_08141 [Sarcoptes scabiei]|uniref:Uncharacterized protein n=1 Tax=Sarcoptes scabiei TaxID=52283 RepID=A0A834R862_SARSC|nr:hypothetical protein SSS_08141 [Sarcoptes scabiei]UXI14232.1 hypothetical protein NH340_JMT00175 [Sarcoptes scabiei]
MNHKLSSVDGDIADRFEIKSSPEDRERKPKSEKRILSLNSTTETEMLLIPISKNRIKQLEEVKIPFRFYRCETFNDHQNEMDRLEYFEKNLIYSEVKIENEFDTKILYEDSHQAFAWIPKEIYHKRLYRRVWRH